MQNSDHSVSVDRLLRRIDSAVKLDDVDAITARIKADLEQILADGGLELPEALCRPESDCYARRLLHRDSDLGYTVVVMVWGPGQKTPLHDHSGIWCVECVVEGSIEITQYELLGEEDGRYRFDRKSPAHASVGEAGRLIPPFEYHVISNDLPDTPSVSLHVYGGEMEHCNLFMPIHEGCWEKNTRQLSYDA